MEVGVLEDSEYTITFSDPHNVVAGDQTLEQAIQSTKTGRDSVDTLGHLIRLPHNHPRSHPRGALIR